MSWMKSNKLKRDKILFLIKVKQLIEKGFPLQHAMKFLFEQMHVLSDQDKTLIIDEIERGASLSDVLNQLNYHQKIVHIISMGEKTGHLLLSIQSSIELLKTYEEERKKLIKTIQYPLMLIMIFMVMIIALKIFVLPHFNHLYTSMNIDDETSIRLLKVLIFNLPNVVLIVIFLSILFLITLYALNATLPKLKFVQLLLKIPIINLYYKEYLTFTICYDFSLFMKSNIAFKEMIDCWKEDPKDRFLYELSLEIENELKKGNSFIDALDSLSIVTDSCIDYLKLSKSTHHMDEELKLVAEFSLFNFKKYLTQDLKKVQPILFTLIGFIIMSIYLILILPMIQMLQVIE